MVKGSRLTKRGVYADINSAVHSSERLNMAALVGSGKTVVDRAALKYGISLLLENRKSQDLFLKRHLYENVTIAILDQVMKEVYLEHFLELRLLPRWSSEEKAANDKKIKDCQ